MRLDPKLRYAAELAARKQRRTLSSFIEWAIEEVLTDNEMSEIDWRGEEEKLTLMEAAEKVWDVDEADRFVNLAFEFPGLMTHEEQQLWKLITTTGAVWADWAGQYQHGDPHVRRSGLRLDLLREHWETFKQVAEGELDKEALPQWEESSPGT
ncbi:hypothetical protein MAIT1_01835 [Magnetofaba australis IT-1]|uniref:Uncharacterized protein n=1 Tax=Magnetofaba australis IT-1 TaxID=1434232 RepID=A0A1Y2K2B6_9PROT|nr:hypothetical protein MAIT1_01835 [Magnetofaba australis IT-1]